MKILLIIRDHLRIVNVDPLVEWKRNQIDSRRKPVIVRIFIRKLAGYMQAHIYINTVLFKLIYQIIHFIQLTAGNSQMVFVFVGICAQIPYFGSIVRPTKSVIKMV